VVDGEAALAGAVSVLVILAMGGGAGEAADMALVDVLHAPVLAHEDEGDVGVEAATAAGGGGHGRNGRRGRRCRGGLLLLEAGFEIGEALFIGGA